MEVLVEFEIVLIFWGCLYCGIFVVDVFEVVCGFIIVMFNVEVVDFGMLFVVIVDLVNEMLLVSVFVGEVEVKYVCFKDIK